MWQPLFFRVENTGEATTPNPGERISLPAGLEAWCLSVGGNRKVLAALGRDGRFFAANLAPPGSFVELQGRSTGSSTNVPGSSTGSERLAVSANGRGVALGSGVKGGGVQVWDARSGERVARFEPDEGTVAFRPDNRWLATARNGNIERWSMENWKLRLRKTAGARTFLSAAPHARSGAPAYSDTTCRFTLLRTGMSARRYRL